MARPAMPARAFAHRLARLKIPDVAAAATADRQLVRASGGARLAAAHDLWQHPKEANSQTGELEGRAQGSGSCWGVGEALPGGRGRERGMQEGTAGPVVSSYVELRGR
eukprot:6651502-Prymnesium_polylepis.1